MDDNVSKFLWKMLFNKEKQIDEIILNNEQIKIIKNSMLKPPFKYIYN